MNDAYRAARTYAASIPLFAGKFPDSSVDELWISYTVT